MTQAQKKPTKEQELRQRVNSALAQFRDTLRAYRQGTGKPALFLRDHEAPELRDDAFAGCRVFANRHKMIQHMAWGGVGAEIGVQHGHFSTFLLNNLAISELHLFDLNGELIQESVRNAERTTLHVGDSSKKLSALPDAHFDWIYVDGDHSYKGVTKDVKEVVKKIKPNGVLFFNDYTPWSMYEAMPYGIMPAVNELINEQGWQMAAIALTPSGYFDVALTR